MASSSKRDLLNDIPTGNTGMHVPTPQLCGQQTRLMTALQSQLQVLANAIGGMDNGEQTQNLENVAKLAYSMELSTVYMTAALSLGLCQPSNDCNVGAAHAKGAIGGDMLVPDGAVVRGNSATTESRWPVQEDSTQISAKELSPPELCDLVEEDAAEKNGFAPNLAHTEFLIGDLEVPTGDKDGDAKELARHGQEPDEWDRKSGSNKGHKAEDRLQSKDTINIADDEESVVPEWKLKCRWVLRQVWFEPLVGLVIFINSLTIGIRTIAAHSGEDESSVLLDVMEYFFFVVYVSELCARILAFGWKILRNHWVQFDAFIVGAMILDLFMTTLPKSLVAGGGDFLSTVTVIRLCRIARLARILRLLGACKTLWSMVQGLLGSAKTLLFAGVILIVILYIFAILGLEIIEVDPERSDLYNETVEYYFADFTKTIMTIFLLGLAMDEIGPIYRGLVLERPILFFYFVVLFMVVSIALLNLTMTLMVDEQMKMAAADDSDKKEKELQVKRDTLDELEKVFKRLDKDGSGNVDKDELEGGPPEVYEAMCKVIGKDDPAEIVRIFEMLDYDNSGHLTIEEFCDGIMMMVSGEPVELNILIKQCKHLRNLASGSDGDGGGLHSTS